MSVRAFICSRIRVRRSLSIPVSPGYLRSELRSKQAPNSMVQRQVLQSCGAPCRMLVWHQRRNATVSTPTTILAVEDTQLALRNAR